MTKHEIIPCLLLILCVITVNKALKIHENRAAHLPKDLTQNEVKILAQMGNTSQIDVILDHILVPRVVGTKSHKKVKNYITSELTRLGFTVEVDNFEEQTPVFGKLRFSNIIGRLSPSADRFLTLACHYDSKYTREYDFIGATDSGVPCAMLLNLANQMKGILGTANPDVSLKLVFFDGEEAFNQWGPTDSIYGARHLAAHWSNQNGRAFNQRITELDRIDLLVLLDLLGTPDPKFYSYFSDTEKWYVRMSQAEERLADLGELRQYSKGHPQQTYFAQRSVRAHIEDDHIPFLRRGVPILHMIPTPFPDVWHTEADNRSAVDMHTVENLNKILRVFVAEYLHLKIPSISA